MLINLSFLYVLTLLNVVHGQGWPGPRDVTSAGNGVFTWTAQIRYDNPATMTYTVKTLTNYPTLVYNCVYMLSICKNAKRYLGGITVQTFVHDRLKHPNSDDHARTDARRDQTCPTNWITQNRKPNGDLRCPEDLQPGWYSDLEYNKPPNGPEPSLLWKDDNGNPDPNNRQMGAIRDVRTVTDPNTGLTRVVTRYDKLGGIFTCDEFPAASWIQGGAGANTICAPMGSTCGKTMATGQSEQNWQGNAHSAMAGYFNRAAAQNGAADSSISNPLWTLFGFNFKLVDDTSVGDATWLEIGGVRRYCFGPDPTNCGSATGLIV